MLSITQRPDPVVDYSGFTKGSSTYSLSNVTRLSSYQQQSKDITIMTAEGDKVTLSANASKETNWLTYSRLVRGDGTMAHLQGKSYALETNQELSITVEGDLSDEECRDIQKAVKIIGRIMPLALAGKTEQALSLVFDIIGLESIADFSAYLEIENTIVIEQQTSLKVFNALPESIPEAEMDLLSIPHDRFKRFIDQLMDALTHQSFRNKKFIKPLNRYFSKLLQKIPEIYEGPERLDKMALANLVRNALLERLAEE